MTATVEPSHPSAVHDRRRGPLRSPASGQWDPQEGLVGAQLTVELHEVLLLPLHHPGEVPVLHLDLEHSREHLGGWNETLLLGFTFTFTFSHFVSFYTCVS